MLWSGCVGLVKPPEQDASKLFPLSLYINSPRASLFSKILALFLELALNSLHVRMLLRSRETAVERLSLHRSLSKLKKKT